MPSSGRLIAFAVAMATSLSLLSAGCGAQQTTPNGAANSAGLVANAPTRKSPVPAITYVKVRSMKYGHISKIVRITGVPVSTRVTGENVIDVSSARGTTNFVFAHYPRVRVKNAIVDIGKGHHLNFRIGQVPLPVPRAKHLPSQRSLTIPPNGVSLDPYLIPLARTSATVAQKRAAVLKVAKSKLGIPYIWGHSEDRGQYGFDCSNFTAYIYHHALGYVMSGESKVQYHDVGTPVPVRDMEVGDLIIFEHGAHVGIYAGHHKMIEEGGGLGKSGYLSVAPGSTWGKRITVVKRVF